jgi:hypothetical protein
MRKTRPLKNWETAAWPWIIGFYLTCLAGMLAVLIYATSQRDRSIDWNVPGATTGKKSLTD